MGLFRFINCVVFEVMKIFVESMLVRIFQDFSVEFEDVEVVIVFFCVLGEGVIEEFMKFENRGFFWEMVGVFLLMFIFCYFY